MSKIQDQNKLTILNIPEDKWCDKDEVMFHACFSILGKFVEEELGTEQWYTDHESGERILNSYRGYREHAVNNDRPLIDLWLWYKEELPKEEAEYDKWITEKYSEPMSFEKDEVTGLNRLIVKHKPHELDKKYSSTWDYLEDLKDKKLSELIDARRTMWT